MPFGTNAKISKRNQEALTKALDVGMAVSRSLFGTVVMVASFASYASEIS